MAVQLYTFDVVVAPGSTPAAPVATNLSMPPLLIAGLEVIVPSGPRGLVGFALGAAGQPVIPFQAGHYIVTDNEKIEWPLEGQIDSGGWQIFAYNLGQFLHTLYVRFLTAPILPPPAGSVLVTNLAALSSS
jgi:hypothetical protein